MPVDTVRKVEALRTDFRSAAQLADLLGVSRSQITRWFTWVIRAGRADELMRAIRAKRSGQFCVMLYRCFAWDQHARPDQPDSPL